MGANVIKQPIRQGLSYFRPLKWRQTVIQNFEFHMSSEYLTSSVRSKIRMEY